MLNTLFTNASTFVAINNALSLRTFLHQSIPQGCLLDPYLYVLTMNALDYLLKTTYFLGKFEA